MLGSVLGLDGLATRTSALREPINHPTLLHAMWIHAGWMDSLTAQMGEVQEPKCDLETQNPARLEHGT